MEQDKSRLYITPCPQHFSGVKANQDLQCRIRDCSVCRRMISQLVSYSQESQPAVFGVSYASGKKSYNAAVKKPVEYKYGGSHHFDDELITIIQNFQNLFKNPITPTSGAP